MGREVLNLLRLWELRKASLLTRMVFYAITGLAFLRHAALGVPVRGPARAAAVPWLWVGFRFRWTVTIRG